MSRFVNLELGGESEENRQPSGTVKDEAYYSSEAQQAFVRGDFEQALRWYSKVLEFNPQNAAAWTGQVRMLIELGEFREAKLWADKALERFPHEPELLASKAVALGRLGDLDGAIAFSDAAIEEHGDSPYIWLARGDVLLAREEKRAEYCFEKAHWMAPQDWFFHWLGSRIQAFYHRFSAALKLAQQALELDATRSVVWLQIGICQQALGLSQQAQQSLAQAKELNPHCLATHRAIQTFENAGWWKRLTGWWQGVKSS